jgi:hypothetical protein
MWPRPGSDFEAGVTRDLLQCNSEQQLPCDLNSHLGSIAVDSSIGVQFEDTSVDPRLYLATLLQCK